MAPAPPGPGGGRRRPRQAVAAQVAALRAAERFGCPVLALGISVEVRRTIRSESRLQRHRKGKRHLQEKFTDAAAPPASRLPAALLLRSSSPRTAPHSAARPRPVPARSPHSPAGPRGPPSGPRSPEPGAAGPGRTRGRGGAPASRSPAGCTREG